MGTSGRLLEMQTWRLPSCVVFVLLEVWGAHRCAHGACVEVRGPSSPLPLPMEPPSLLCAALCTCAADQQACELLATSCLHLLRDYRCLLPHLTFCVSLRDWNWVAGLVWWALLTHELLACFVSLLLFDFETGSYFVAKTDLKLEILP